MSNTHTSRKIQVIQTALKHFSDHGYKATTMRDLAQAMELQVSSLYNHISSKESLLEELCEAMSEVLSGAQDAVKRAKLSPLASIQLLVEKQFLIQYQHSDLLHVYIQEAQHLPKAARKKVQAAKMAYETVLFTWVERCINSGQMAEIDSDVIVQQLLSSLLFYKLHVNQLDTQPDFNVLAKVRTQLLLKGMVVTN